MRVPKSSVIAHKKIDADETKIGKEEPKKRASLRKTSAVSKPLKNVDVPKRPPSAFFIFMGDFRKKFKEEFPDNKSAAAVGKAGGEKWKSMSATDKAPYTQKAMKKKAEYEDAKSALVNKKLTNDHEDEEKSTCESYEVGSDLQEATSSS